MPLWKLGIINIITSESKGNPNVKFAEHNPLDSVDSVFHRFGYGGSKRNLVAWLLDNPEDYPHLESYHRLLTTVELSGPFGVEGQYKITNLDYEDIHDISRLSTVSGVSYMPKKLTLELTAVNSGSR